MTLGDYLDMHDIRLTEFARRVGTTKATIWRVINGQVMPRRQLMTEIHRATGGAVCPNDLLQLFPPATEAPSEVTHGSE